MKQVLVTVPLLPRHREALEEAGKGCAFSYCSAHRVTREMVAGADILIGNVAPGLIGGSERLEWVHLASSGADAYVKPGVLHERTLLTCSTGAYSKSVAEHALAQTLMLQKNLHLYRDNQNRACWKDEGPVSSIADGVTAVIGLGEIGLHYARMVKALGGYVLGVKRREGARPECVDELYTMESLEVVLGRADVVMSVLPETSQTHHLFSKERFALMKRTALFINVGRGGAVAPEVLEEALTEGLIAGAAVDVAEPEPLPADSPLWRIPNLVITPHVAGDFHLPETLDRVAAMAAGNLKAWLAGEEPANLVDRESGYRK